MGVEKRADGNFKTRAIVPGRRGRQAHAFALAASPSLVGAERTTHPGYALPELVLRCWAAGIPVWGADVAFGGRIVPYDYSSNMRGKRDTHQFEHAEAKGLSTPCKGHGPASCDAIALSLGDGLRRWRHDGEPGAAEADVPLLARERLNEVAEYLRSRGQGETNIAATPSIAQLVDLLGSRRGPVRDTDSGADSDEEARPLEGGGEKTRNAARRERQYWALLVNPNYYRIEEALLERDEDSWTTDGADLFTGDRVVIWKARGREQRRGIVAFGTVLTEPRVTTSEPDPDPLWTHPERGLGSELRVRVRYEHADCLPLWTDEPGNEFLLELPVARSRGRSAFRMTEEQWTEIARLADFTADHDSEETVRIQRAVRRITDSPRNKAVELRAMEEAERYLLEAGWEVTDVSGQRGLGYDLHCTRGDNEELHVEVKGTTTDGSEVTLTRNEVAHARERCTALFVVSRIQVSYDDDDNPHRHGRRALRDRPVGHR